MFVEKVFESWHEKANRTPGEVYRAVRKLFTIFGWLFAKSCAVGSEDGSRFPKLPWGNFLRFLGLFNQFKARHAPIVRNFVVIVHQNSLTSNSTGNQSSCMNSWRRRRRERLAGATTEHSPNLRIVQVFTFEISLNWHDQNKLENSD